MTSMRKKIKGAKIGEMMRATSKEFSIILVVLFIASAVGQRIPAKGTESSSTQVDSAHDIKFAEIERNITGENNPSELVIKPRSMTEIYLSLGVLAFGSSCYVYRVLCPQKKHRLGSGINSCIYNLSDRHSRIVSHNGGIF